MVMTIYHRLYVVLQKFIDETAIVVNTSLVEHVDVASGQYS
jgi:hypothetical protein